MTADALHAANLPKLGSYLQMNGRRRDRLACFRSYCLLLVAIITKISLPPPSQQGLMEVNLETYTYHVTPILKVIKDKTIYVLLNSFSILKSKVAVENVYGRNLTQNNGCQSCKFLQVEEEL